MIAFGFYKFLMEHYIGKDITSILAVDPAAFITELNQEVSEKAQRINEVAVNRISGTIYLYGLNLSTNKIEGYYLLINKTTEAPIWTKLNYVDDNAIAMAPGVENYWDKIENLGDPYKMTKSLMIVQKQEDEQLPVIDRVGIGGEITYTVLGFNENDDLIITTVVSHTFPDYQRHFEIMMRNR